MATRSELLQFADRHLSPYHIRGDELIPELCPFCHGGESGDKNTFALNLEDEVFVCKRGSCGERGRLNELTEFLGDQSIAEKPQVGLPSAKKKKKIKPLDFELLPRTEQIDIYFNRRRITTDTLTHFNISADMNGNIVFPFYMNKSLVYLKFRQPRKPDKESKAPKEWASRDTVPILFGMDLCDPQLHEPLVITEGQIDAMAVYEAGYTNVVSVPSGCENFDWIEPCWDWLEQFKTIVIFGDNDEPGQKMVQTLVRRLDEARCKIVKNYPAKPSGNECKDPNEVLYFSGAAAIVECIENAEAVPLKGVIRLADVVPRDPTQVERIKTFIPKLDECLNGLEEAAVTLFTGKSGHGKSTVTGLLLLNAIEQGHSVCAYSGELSKYQFQQWINLQAAGSEWITLKYDPVKEKQVPIVDPGAQARIMEWYRDSFYLFDNTEIFEENQAEAILQVFTMMARRYGCKLFLVDNILTALSDSEREIEAQGKFINALKRFALRYNAHVLFVAHARKTQLGMAIQQDDVSGNSALIKLSTNAVVAERPNLRVLKARDAGINTTIECCYCADSRRVYQANAGDRNTFSWDRTGLTPPRVRADSMEEYGIQLAQQEPI